MKTPPPLRALFAALAIAASAAAAPRLLISVTNVGHLDRPSETLTLPWSEVLKALPGAQIDHLRLVGPDNRTLPYQVINMNPETIDSRPNPLVYGDLVFQWDFTAAQAQAEFALEATDTVTPPFSPRVFARFVPERFDDFAWENDCIAHRTYGPALAMPDIHHTGKEVDVSSGIDVWCKRVNYLTVDRWYTKGHYHVDTGEGLDMYSVRTSRGCGGTGIWNGTKLATSRNFTKWKVIANGPIRAVFELGYDAWMADGRRVAETKRYTVDAGHNLDQVESTFTVVEGSLAPLTVAIGLEKDSADAGQDPVVAVRHAPSEGSLSVWETEKTRGAIGTAVIAPLDAFSGYADGGADELVLVKVTPGKPIRFLAGAGWSKAGVFTDQKSWESYVSHCFARIAQPVSMTLKVSP